ncbi:MULTISPECIES: SigE family RNA polymerase sigma factor [unclassified Isoptericola]|uniref:SigE family RNA polymerase sigma factor n=1 Tax=unclassified Isoptericola TaxID=2623355 RepID=UPI0027136AD8|nr:MULTISPECIES: SigE family RNA polymerase sigma factor [unclassified Isoptericola]MDO8143655.1 SigE family RNA polymerase sigma factor [Isoptericola sp. 178]MDO8150147.1 SigE family RNA polymerase sigma factor [Isoptericola sp. b408]
MTARRAEGTAPPVRDSARAGRDTDVEVRLTHADRNAEFTAFMRAHTDVLHRMAYLLCGDRHRAEELVQQTFERTYRHWGRARDGDPLAYARRILANVRIDTWRRTRREVSTSHDDLSGAPSWTGRPPPGRAETGTVDDRDAVVRALLLLPVKQRRVVVMRHLLELSEAEVAGELGLPTGTVKSTASRGLHRLRTLLDLDGLRSDR